MKLIGRNLSPYTRRVAIALSLLGIAHEREYFSPTKDPMGAFAFNPVGRVPVLILDDGERLIESGAILDYLMELAGPERALIPATGQPRRECLQIMAMATATLDKAVAAIVEQSRRPAEKVHRPWLDHLMAQATGGLKALEARPQSPWLMGEKMTMADVTVAVMLTALKTMLPALAPAGAYPRLESLTARCEALSAFRAHTLETP
jgi:glutathione S-transferase